MQGLVNGRSLRSNELNIEAKGRKIGRVLGEGAASPKPHPHR